MVSETALYEPVKTMLEGRGYEVKAEVNGCDVVACKADAPVVIVELKLAFTLDLVLQGVSRLAVTDDVYLAVMTPNTTLKRKNWRAKQRGYLKLCRRLGLGLMTIDLERKSGTQIKILLDPTAYKPRKNKRQQTRLMAEFEMRTGDPNTGGVTQTKIITAYRQDALRCAITMQNLDDMKIADIRSVAEVPKAAAILQKNHYGWFERTGRGRYRLSTLGLEALKLYADLLPTLTSAAISK
jgi:hypothetical protein